MSQVLNLFDWANRSPKPRNNVIKFGTSVNKTEPMLQKKKICLDCGKKEITKKHTWICHSCKHTQKRRYLEV